MEGSNIPWEALVEPMTLWLSFILALSLMLICMSSILHRQWSVYERLAYPMVQLPQNMIEKDSDSLIAPFFRSGIM